MLTNTDIIELTSLRRNLHKSPELSGEEEQTARFVAGEMRKLNPNRLITHIGGHGVAAVFDGNEKGPTLLFRAELDALPIEEKSGVDWASDIRGKGHLCGHDGHMTILFGLARMLSRQRSKIGRVVLMFQPAEEDGSGAKAVVNDPNYAELSPDWAFAIHNEPGLPFGYVGITDGLMNCASRGLKIKFEGRTSHAAEPEFANSPLIILPNLLQKLDSLGEGGLLTDAFKMSTVTHVSVGEATFGITPGEAVIFVTLRAALDSALEHLHKDAVSLATTLANDNGLLVSFEIHDDFAASFNHVDAVKVAEAAMDSLSISYGCKGVPMRASEDFGAFGWAAKAAMLCLGPGENHVALHQPEYDFPDELIPLGAKIFEKITRDLIG